MMKDRINQGDDLHKYYASVLTKKPVDEISKQERQQAKAANFGFPGGLGIKNFVTYALDSYGVTLTEKQAKEMKEAWFKAFPEVRQYMKRNTGLATTLTGRVRSNCSYCQEKNTPFQGLAADGAKLALYDLIFKHGINVVGFVHDEIVSQARDGEEEKVKKIQEEVMISAMKKVIPDVKISVESKIDIKYGK